MQTARSWHKAKQETDKRPPTASDSGLDSAYLENPHDAHSMSPTIPGAREIPVTRPIVQGYNGSRRSRATNTSSTQTIRPERKARHETLSIQIPHFRGQGDSRTTRSRPDLAAADQSDNRNVPTSIPAVPSGGFRENTTRPAGLSIWYREKQWRFRSLEHKAKVLELMARKGESDAQQCWKLSLGAEPEDMEKFKECLKLYTYFTGAATEKLLVENGAELLSG